MKNYIPVRIASISSRAGTAKYAPVRAEEASMTSPSRAIVLGLLFLSVQAEARVWNVPGDAPSVQAGIDSSAAGDSVLVAPGTYSEPPQPIGSELTMILMKPGVRLIGSGPGVTTLDAQGAARVITLYNDSLQTTIAGFTITGGNAGGIAHASAALSSFLVANCALTNNSGGAFGTGGNYVELRDCSVRNNSGARAVGGGSSGGSLVIVRCQI